MPTYSRSKTWNASETLTATDLNGIEGGLVTFFNTTQLDNDNIQSTASYVMGELVIGSGITSADGGQLHVHTASAGTIAAHADADEAVIENSAAAGISILSGNTSAGNLFFGDDGDNDIGKVSYSHSTNAMTFTTNAATALTLSSAQLATFAAGVTVGGNVISDTDSTDDLGTTGVRWANLYVDSIGDSGQGLAVDSSSVRMANIPSITVCAANGGVANVTGDGTAYTVVFGSEIIDQGADFSSTTFTAPVAGQYAVSGQILVDGIGSSHTFASLQIVTSNRTYYQQLNPYGYESGTATPIPFSVITDMDASDTLHLSLVVSGGTKTININNTSSTNVRTYLSVQMIA